MLLSPGSSAKECREGLSEGPKPLASQQLLSLILESNQALNRLIYRLNRSRQPEEQRELDHAVAVLEDHGSYHQQGLWLTASTLSSARRVQLLYMATSLLLVAAVFCDTEYNERELIVDLYTRVFVAERPCWRRSSGTTPPTRAGRCRSMTRWARKRVVN